MKTHRKGIALISTFMFLTMLFMMALSMILMSRQRVFVGMDQHRQSQALYLAEAGLAKAQVALESSVDWSGATDANIDGLEGVYTIKFGSGTDKFDSVNNINQATSTNSYRGSGTVPPNHALIIVEATVGGQHYTLESLIKGEGSIGYVSDAILASGKIRTKGDLIVDGISALDDASEVAGSIQSNETGGSDLIVWEGGGTALVTGNVSSMGSSSAAINMDGATILGGTQLSTLANIPNTDIQAEVDANSSSPLPNFVTGGTSTLAGGNYFQSGSVNADGDIVLKGDATLYIDGDFTVNGSISGSGKVYVTGNTTFKGDSSITTNPDFSVSLYSKGDVSLTGFDGTDFLKNMTGPVPDLLARAETQVEILQTILASENRVLNETTKNAVWDAGAALGFHHIENDKSVQQAGFLSGTPEMGLLIELRAAVDALPEGSTRNFVSRRVNILESVFTTADLDGFGFDIPGQFPEANAIANFNSTGETQGFLDAVVGFDPSYWPQALNLIDQINYDRLGTSHFQGAIYTNGHFYADNEVSILGALIVDGNGTGEKTIALADGETVTLKSGDIYLGKRSRVTYVEEMFKDGGSPTSGPQLLSKRIWMGR